MNLTSVQAKLDLDKIVACSLDNKGFAGARLELIENAFVHEIIASKLCQLSRSTLYLVASLMRFAAQASSGWCLQNTVKLPQRIITVKSVANGSFAVGPIVVLVPSDHQGIFTASKQSLATHNAFQSTVQLSILQTGHRVPEGSANTTVGLPFAARRAAVDHKRHMVKLPGQLDCRTDLESLVGCDPCINQTAINLDEWYKCFR